MRARGSSRTSSLDDRGRGGIAPARPAAASSAVWKRASGRDPQGAAGPVDGNEEYRRNTGVSVREYRSAIVTREFELYVKCDAGSVRAC